MPLLIKQFSLARSETEMNRASTFAVVIFLDEEKKKNKRTGRRRPEQHNIIRESNERKQEKH